jgi:hypothetical protein
VRKLRKRFSERPDTSPGILLMMEIREQDNRARHFQTRKTFQSHRVDSVRRQTPDPPASACMANIGDWLTARE